MCIGIASQKGGVGKTTDRNKSWLVITTVLI